MPIEKKKLGELLIEGGLITEVQLKSALTDQQIWGGRVGSHLVKMGALDEEQLVEFLSRQLDVPRIDFRKSKIHKEALALLPRKVCEKYCVVPVACKDTKGHKKILLSMCDPTNLEAISEVEFLTGGSVSTVVAAESDIQTAINYCFTAEGIRDSEGLHKVLETTDKYPTGLREEEVVIMTQDGHEKVLVKEEEEEGFNFNAVRAILELLFEKNVFTPEEFHHHMDRIEQEQGPAKK